MHMYRNLIYSFHKFAVIILLITAFAGCASPDGNPEANKVFVNLKDVIPTAIRLEDGLLLDGPSLGAVEDVIIADSLLIVKSGNALYGFSLRTGKWEVTFSRSGRGPGEYIRIWDFGLAQDNTLYLYDIDGKQVLFFHLPTGLFSRSVSLSESASDNPFQCIIPTPDGEGYVGKRIYGMPSVPELSLYDSDFRYVKDLGNTPLRSGLKLWRQLFPGSDGDILYTRYFSNEILGIRGDSIYEKYSVDFPGNNLPDLGDDEYDYLEATGDERSAGKYAVIMSNLMEDADTFGFQFGTNGHRCYALYDKQTGQCRAYMPEIPTCTVLQILYAHGKLIVIGEKEDKGILIFSCRAEN